MQKKTVILLISVDIHPQLADDLPDILKSYLECEGLLSVRAVLLDEKNLFETSDLPYVSSLKPSSIELKKKKK
jgi:hypothetical protein